MKRTFLFIIKSFVAIVALAAAFIVVSNISLIYSFDAPKPFSGPDIYNPYRNCPDSIVWKKANFHTHTRINGPLNECPLWPDQVKACYDSLGYDFVSISNHNKLTEDSSGARTYEHGYNFFKYHLLAFGSDRVTRSDCLLPVLVSQRQFIIDLTRHYSDMIQVNHPARTPFTTQRTMSLLSDYRLIELDSGITTDNEYWDWALSAGHYSFGVANDDLHNPLNSANIARRCNFLACNSMKSGKIERCLLSGAFYSMRIPDFGDGDWSIKYAQNKNLPSIRGIGVTDDDEIFIRLSEKADSIRFTGQDSGTLALFAACDSASYRLPSAEPYARITAFFPNGCVIYSNPFPRYNAAIHSTPFVSGTHRIDWVLTVAYNILNVFITFCILYLAKKLFKRPRFRFY